MNKSFKVAGVLAVLGAGILLGKSIGRDNDLWLEPVAPDTGAGWSPPADAEVPVNFDAVTALAAREARGAVAIADAKEYYRLIVHGPPEVITPDSFKCNNPYRVYAMLLYVVAVSAPQSTTYPVPVGDASEGNFFIAAPDMDSATTEFTQGPSTFCSVRVRMGVLNQGTGKWQDYPPPSDHTVFYEIVRTDDGKVRTHYLKNNGTRFN